MNVMSVFDAIRQHSAEKRYPTPWQVGRGMSTDEYIRMIFSGVTRFVGVNYLDMQCNCLNQEESA